MDKKVILITGASSGIGLATAQKLAENGYTVCAAARRLEKMDSLKASGVVPFKMDITQKEDVNSVVDQITSTYGGIDILINNAGFGMYGVMEDIPLEEARYQFEVNLFGLAYLTQQVLPTMREKRYGKIVNISSIGGKVYIPLGAWYHATKHALEGFSDCLRLEVKPFNIDVIIIQPGIIKTNFGSVMIQQMESRSGGSAYASITDNIIKSFQNSLEDPNYGSDPSVVANQIAKAISVRKPKTRYAVGKFAKPMLFLRRYTSDRFFDKIIMRNMSQ